MKSLYKMCARRTLLPGSLYFELPEDPVGVVVYRGGFGDVLKREHRGREVAVKALRVYDNNLRQDIADVSHFVASNPLHALRAEHGICRGYARRSLLGNPFGIRMCYRCWG